MLLLEDPNIPIEKVRYSKTVRGCKMRSFYKPKKEKIKQLTYTIKQYDAITRRQTSIEQYSLTLEAMKYLNVCLELELQKCTV